MTSEDEPLEDDRFDDLPYDVLVDGEGRPYKGPTLEEAIAALRKNAAG